jgi:hypothetical protein
VTGLDGNDRIVDFSFSDKDVLTFVAPDEFDAPGSDPVSMLDALGEITVATVGVDQADVLIQFIGGGSVRLENIAAQLTEDVDSLSDINKLAGYEAITTYYDNFVIFL